MTRINFPDHTGDASYKDILRTKETEENRPMTSNLGGWVEQTLAWYHKGPDGWRCPAHHLRSQRMTFAAKRWVGVRQSYGSQFANFVLTMGVSIHDWSGSGSLRTASTVFRWGTDSLRKAPLFVTQQISRCWTMALTT